MKQKPTREELAKHHSHICLQLLQDYPTMIRDIPIDTLKTDINKLVELRQIILEEIARRD